MSICVKSQLAQLAVLTNSNWAPRADKRLCQQRPISFARGIQNCKKMRKGCPCAAHTPSSQKTCSSRDCLKRVDELLVDELLVAGVACCGCCLRPCLTTGADVRRSYALRCCLAHKSRSSVSHSSTEAPMFEEM